MKNIGIFLLFVSISLDSSERDWCKILSGNVTCPPGDWVLVRERDLHPPVLPAVAVQLLTSGKPVSDGFRRVNPAHPIIQLARNIEERGLWEQYLRRDRRRRWIQSILAYADSVVKIMPEVATGIIENQTR